MNDNKNNRLTEEPGISLQELTKMVMRRKWVVMATASALFVIVTIVSFLTPPTYTAEGQILIEREPNILSFEDVLQIESFNDDYFQTQYRLLQSRTLAGDTIDRLPPPVSEKFARTVFKNEKGLPGDFKADPVIRGYLIDAFLGRLSIRPVSKTRLVQATFSDRDPQLAATVLNAIFEAYIEMNVQKRFRATEQATDFLTGQIATIREEIAANEKKLQAYSKEKNIIALNSAENTVIEKLGELNKALTDAQITRINKETYYNEIRVATPDYIPNALNDSLIQRLGEEYNRLYRDYVKRSERFLPDYPEIQSLKAELDTAKKALETETQAVINRAYTDFQAALSRERALAGVFNLQKGEAFQLNSNAIEYNSLLIQIQNQKNLLESLMKRKSETDVSARLKGLRTSNIWIVDKAEIPMSPSSPHKAKNMVLAFVIGLFAGLGLAILLERLDKTVKDSDDIEKYGGIPMLGMVPAFIPKEQMAETEGTAEEENQEAGESGLPSWSLPGPSVPKPPRNPRSSLDIIVHLSPESSIAEYYRSIRTTLLFSAAETKLRTMAVTSPMPQDGKTVTICNLAIVLAQTGKRVVLVDADLRKPRLHEVFRVKNLNGLSRGITADLALEDLLHATPIPMLSLVNSGPVPPNPLELLGSEKMSQLIDRLSQSFDYVLVDTPPLMAVSDALVVGSLLDGELLVVRAGKTPREALRQSQEKMTSHNINILGVIINYAPMRDFNEYHLSSYRKYRARTEA